MNKKILVGCIGATVILIFASFTSVVGIQSSEKLSVKEVSPLFGMRTQKAINEELKEMTTADYIGKENVELLLNILNFKEYFSEFYSLIPTLTEPCSPTGGSIICWVLWTILACPLIIIMLIGRGIRSVLNLETCDEKTCDIWCTMYLCSQNNELNYDFYRKIKNNLYFNKLVTGHPELVSEIIELNS